MKSFNFWVIFLISFLFFESCKKNIHSQEENKKLANNMPNVIFILADDLGYADLGCYGQKHFRTPNIDELANSGMLFTQHYAGSTVCAPSRSVLLTGLHTGHTPIRGNKEIQPEGQYPISDSIYTLAEMFKDAGYITGAFGKWGLGFPGSEGDPNKQGFDEFYGYNCQRLAHNYYPYYLWDNQIIDSLPGNKGYNKNEYSPDLIQEKALSFIEDNKGKPFFLYYPTTLPHAELAAPDTEIDYFKEKVTPGKAYEGYDKGPDYRKGPYGSQKDTHATYAAMIHFLDEKVGEIIQKINNLGLAENTIIVFTSDNGPSKEGGSDPEYFDSNGKLRGFKRDLYEGGIRVPLIISWPGTVPKGVKSDHISGFWDFMPTFADIVQSSSVKQVNVDGISFLPTLQNKKDQKEHDHLYWEFHEKGGRQAVRKGKWKAVRNNVLTNPSSPVELYDLSNDIGETNNISSKHLEVAREMSQLMKNSRAESPVFKFSSSTYLDSK